MPNPGKFHGKRKEFLNSKRALFDTSVDNDRVPDILLKIYREYFKCFPMSMREDEEPTDEALAVVDDNAAEPEVESTALDELSGEAYDAALGKMKADRDALDAKKGQIKRWFYYRYMRDHAHDPRSTDPSNPYNAIIMQLSGLSREKRPRCKTPINIWCKEPESVQAIQAEWDKIGTSIPATKRAAKRAELASALFKTLPAERHKYYADRAKEEHQVALKKWTEASMGEVSTAPADRQWCISALPQFVQPWLDSLAEATGFKFLLTAGGPEPIRGGRLNVISMYSGTTNGAVPLTFGQAERDEYVEELLPRFGRFLKACYTPEECKKRALVAADSESSLQSVAMDEGAVFHSFGLHTTDSQRTEVVDGATAAVSAVSNVVDVDASLSGCGAEVLPPIHSDLPNPHPATENTSSAANILLDEVNKALADVIAHSERGSPAPSLIPTPVASEPHSRIASPPNGPVIDGSTLASGESVPAPPLTSESSVAGAKRSRDEDDSTPSSAKRARAVVEIIAPPSAPKWVKEATSMLASADYPGCWQELIAVWLVYEGYNDFADTGRLLPKGRPQVVADWIKWARKPSYKPKPLPNLTLIERQHKAWWASLQPEWRQSNEATTPSTVEDRDWGRLHVFGVNGLISALASLYFWGMSLMNSDTDTSAWETAVEDCLSVVRQLPRPL